MLYRYARGSSAATIAILLGTSACMGYVETPGTATTRAPLQSADADTFVDAGGSESAEENEAAQTHGVRNGLIHLPRSMIGVRLLESIEVALTGASPDIKFVKPRIVYFALYNDQLALFEINSVSPHRDLRADHLIDTFPVLQSSPDTVVFAAPQQLRGISAAFPWDVADAPLPGPMRYAEGTVLDVDHAVLEEVTLEHQTLSMRHAVTVRTKAGLGFTGMDNPEGVVLSTRYVRTTLSPYRPSSTFTPLEIQGGEGRYFQVATVTPNTAELSFRAMHWDMHPSRGPITFGLARQMPPKAAQAIEEGLNYWNQVTGRPILRVERDVDLESWDGPRHVPVHWITWDTAPASHMAVQADPLTGEIIAARMFLSSGFSVYGVQQFTREARLAAQEEPQVAASHAAADPLSQSLYERAQSDTLRLLAAHECGHVLGLRHNFAGMLDSDMPDPAQAQQAARAYVRGRAMDQRVASTVMAYPGPRTNLMLGSYIEKNALPYDVAAIALLYAPQGEDVGVPPQAFCTDTEAGRVYGCSLWLDGVDVLRDSADKARAARFDIAITLLQDLHQAVQRNGGRCDAGAYNHLSLDAIAEPIERHAETVLTAFQATDAVAVRQRYGALKHLDPTMYQTVVRDHIRDRSEKVGGLAGWIGHALDTPAGVAPAPGWLQRDIAFHLAHGSLPDLMKAPEGTRLWVEQIALAWSERIEELVIKKIVEALTAQQNFPQMTLAGNNPASYPCEMVGATWEGSLSALATDLILATSDDEQPRYREDVRLAAVHLLSPHVFNCLGFAEEARKKLEKQLDARINEGTSKKAHRRITQRAMSDAKVRQAIRRLGV